MEIDAKRAKLSRWLTVGLIALAGLAVSPIIFLAVKGLVGLAVAFVIGSAMIAFAPVVAMKLANWKLKGIKHEARTNPIETLQNLYLEKVEALKRFAGSITDFSTQVRNFEAKVGDFSRIYPARAKEFQGQLSQMQDLLSHRKTLYTRAKGELELFDKKVAEARALWEMSQAAQEMNRAAGLQTGDPMEAIKAETAIDAVQESVNKSFAQLETALLEEQPRMTIDVTPERIQVAR